MKEKKSLIIKLICTFSVLLAIFVAVGFSDYVVNGGLNTSDKISENDNVVENNEKVTLSFKYAVTEGVTTEQHEKIFIKSGTTQNKTDFNAFYTYINGMISENITEGSTISASSHKYTGKGEYEGFWIVLDVSEEIKKTSGTCGGEDKYFGTYTIYKQQFDTIIKSYDYYGKEVKDKISIAKNSTLSRSDIQDILSLTDDSNYKLVGLSEEGTDGLPKETVLSFPIKVTVTKTYYALFNKTEMTGVTKYVLGKTISGYTSGEHTFNALAATNEMNLTNDVSYFKEDNTVFLGDKISTIVTAEEKTVVGSKIAADVIVNFGLNSGEKELKYQVSAPVIGLDNDSHKLQYRVALQSDLYVYGSLLIGSNYGNSASSGAEGQIAKEYVEFDLNGHNIFVYGAFDSFGLLTNSKDEGEVVICGGKFTTLAVVQDYRGGRATSSLAGSNIFPFQVYSLPYFRCNARIYNMNNKFGKFIAKCSITIATTLGATRDDIILPLIGSSDEDVLFKLEKTSQESIVEIKGFSQDKVIEDSTSKQGERTNCLSNRIKFSFINCRAALSKITFKISTSKIDTSAFNFPVSSFFDVYLKNTEMTFSQSLKFMPGMSLIADKDSKVILSYDSSTKKVAQISVLGNSAIYQCSEKGKMITNDFVAEAPCNFGKTFFVSQSLWKYYSGNRIKIYGTLIFKGGNKSYGNYLLTGAMDFSRVAYSSDGTTSNLEYIDYSESDNPFAKLMQKHSDVTIKTYGYDYLLGDNNRNNVIKGYSRPLVSYGKGYYANASADGAKVGDYSFTTGIFKVSDSEIYYFDSGTAFSLNDNSTCNLKACTYDEIEHVFIDKASNEKFAYFASSYYPYTNSNDTITLNTTRANETVKSVTVQWNSALERWLRV